MALLDGYQRFLADRIESIRSGTVCVAPGDYRGTLLLRGNGKEVEAWRCRHAHSNPGLAFVCALTQRSGLRGRTLPGPVGQARSGPGRGSKPSPAKPPPA